MTALEDKLLALAQGNMDSASVRIDPRELRELCLIAKGLRSRVEAGESKTLLEPDRLVERPCAMRRAVDTAEHGDASSNLAEASKANDLGMSQKGPVCRCGHPATSHAVCDEELRECARCACCQYEPRRWALRGGTKPAVRIRRAIDEAPSLTETQRREYGEWFCDVLLELERLHYELARTVIQPAAEMEIEQPSTVEPPTNSAQTAENDAKAEGEQEWFCGWGWRAEAGESRGPGRRRARARALGIAEGERRATERIVAFLRDQNGRPGLSFKLIECLAGIIERNDHTAKTDEVK